MGLLGDYFTQGCDDAVTAGYESLLSTVEQLGARFVQVDIPSAERAHHIGYHVLFTEAWAIHAAQRQHFEDYDPVALRRIARGSATSAQDYLLMLSFRAELQREFSTALDQADVLLMPGTPSTAPSLDDLCVEINGQRVPIYQAQSRATIMCNLSGAPAVMVPTGLSNDGLPVAAQWVGRPHGDALLLQIAAACQKATIPIRAKPVGT